MVNTFITNKDYSISAKNLDLTRLRKEIVEAYQIERILQGYKIICKYGKELIGIDFGDFPPEVNEEELNFSIYDQAKYFHCRGEWMKMARKAYHSQPLRIYFINGKYGVVNITALPFVIQRGTAYGIMNEGLTPDEDFTKRSRSSGSNQEKVVVWSKDAYDHPLRIGVLTKEETKKLFPEFSKKKLPAVIFKRSDVVISEKGDLILVQGFDSHAIVKMWIGYHDSLKDYINAHIKEYCSRETTKGVKCNIAIKPYAIHYPINGLMSSGPIKPWWIENFDGVIISHKASLLRKERAREEQRWYWDNPSFTSIPEIYINELGYIWPNSQTGDRDEQIEKIIEMMNNSNDLFRFSSPISADLSVKMKKKNKMLKE